MCRIEVAGPARHLLTKYNVRAFKQNQARQRNSRAETHARRKETRSPQDKQHGRQKGTGKHEKGEGERRQSTARGALSPDNAREKILGDWMTEEKMRKSSTSGKNEEKVYVKS